MAETRVNPIKNRPTANARPITEVKKVARPQAQPNPRVKVGESKRQAVEAAKVTSKKLILDK